MSKFPQLLMLSSFPKLPKMVKKKKKFETHTCKILILIFVFSVRVDWYILKISWKFSVADYFFFAESTHNLYIHKAVSCFMDVVLQHCCQVCHVTNQLEKHGVTLTG